MRDERRVYSFRLEEKMMEKLKVHAKEDNRTLSNLVETILKSYIASKPDQRDAN